VRAEAVIRFVHEEAQLVELLDVFLGYVLGTDTANGEQVMLAMSGILRITVLVNDLESFYELR
jgi:hypothetical protein